jgi:hypothetical protein
MDLVKVQVDSGLSQSIKTLNQLTKMSGAKKPTSELKAAVALVMVLEFGLAAMKPYISEILKLSQKDMSEFMKLFFEARELGIKKHLK